MAKVWQVVDVNGDVVFDGLTCEDEAETYVERSHLAGVAVVERDTVKEAAEALLIVCRDLVLLFESWRDGIFKDIGIVWTEEPSAVRQAHVVIEKAEGRR